MNLPEFRARELLTGAGIRYPESGLAYTPRGARAVAAGLGGKRVVVKAQVAWGGRGKAGGILFADNPDEAAAAAARLLDQGLAGANGARITVRLVMLQPFVETVGQYYAAATLLSGTEWPMALFSARGGVEIEELAVNSPGELATSRIDPFRGLRDFQVRSLLERLEAPREVRARVGDVLSRLARLLLEQDVLLAEINPLAVTAAGEVLGLDAKAVLDNNARFRRGDLFKRLGAEVDDDLERVASAAGVSYVRLDGSVGCLVNGAGLAMEVMDVIRDEGGEAANFLDVGGGADLDRIMETLEILVGDERIRSVLVNIFGGILRCELVAEALLKRFPDGRLPWPVVMRLKGHGAAKAQRMLREAGLRATFDDQLRSAVAQAVRQARL